MSSNTETAPAADFIRNWIAIQEKEANPEIIQLIVGHLSGINLEKLDEDNLIKDLINLANKGVKK